jgi:DNA-binding protein H-NS
MRKLDLNSMSTDELWELHEAIADVLTGRIEAEKSKLEERLRQLNRFPVEQSKTAAAAQPPARRPYQKVLPKYRNPSRPSETWSGRGKRPRWLAKQLKSGRKIDDFRISHEEQRKA